MKYKRINLSDEDAKIFDLLKQEKNMTNEELMSELIRSYYTHSNELDVLLEYIKLLVKTNGELKQYTSEEEMYQVVNNESRFNSLIEEKLHAGKKF